MTAVRPAAPVVACALPRGSLLGPDLVAAATYQDCYRLETRRQDLDITEVFLAIFGHHPWWMRLALVARNRIASLAGLEAPRASEVFSDHRPQHYAVGERIGVWPIFALAEDEIIAGRDNRHLDFRVSVMRVREGDSSSVTVATVCMAHNRSGRWYLAGVVPFHRRGVRLLLERALAAGRL